MTVVLALEAHNQPGQYDAGEENDLASLDDYIKHLGMSAQDIQNKYHHSDYSTYKNSFKGKESLPSIEGIHWNWDINITPEIDSLLMGNKAIWIKDDDTRYYHDATNSAEVYIEVNPEQARILQGKIDLKPYKGPSSGIAVFNWEGLSDIISVISKMQAIKPPSKYQMTAIVPNKKTLDPRRATIKRPEEDRETWLQRSVTNKYPAPQDASRDPSHNPAHGSPYDPSDGYYKKD